MDSVLVIIISILSLIIGYIAGVFLPLKFRKEDSLPKISVGPFQQTQNYFEVSNHARDILNMKIKIFWMQEGVKKEREMVDFFNANEDPAFGSPHKCNSLKGGETKKVIHCPLYSDNGIVIVKIEGETLGGKKYFKELTVNNVKDPKFKDIKSW